MKNGTDQGFDQHYNAQLVVAHESLLVVGTSLSNHPNDQGEVAPTLDAIAPALEPLTKPEQSGSADKGSP